MLPRISLPLLLVAILGSFESAHGQRVVRPSFGEPSDPEEYKESRNEWLESLQRSGEFDRKGWSIPANLLRILPSSLPDRREAPRSRRQILTEANTEHPTLLETLAFDGSGIGELKTRLTTFYKPRKPDSGTWYEPYFPWLWKQSCLRLDIARRLLHAGKVEEAGEIFLKGGYDEDNLALYRAVFYEHNEQYRQATAALTAFRGRCPTYIDVDRVLTGHQSGFPLYLINHPGIGGKEAYKAWSDNLFRRRGIDAALTWGDLFARRMQTLADESDEEVDDVWARYWPQGLDEDDHFIAKYFFPRTVGEFKGERIIPKPAKPRRLGPPPTADETNYIEYVFPRQPAERFTVERYSGKYLREIPTPIGELVTKPGDVVKEWKDKEDDFLEAELEIIRQRVHHQATIEACTTFTRRLEIREQQPQQTASNHLYAAILHERDGNYDQASYFLGAFDTPIYGSVERFPMRTNAFVARAILQAPDRDAMWRDAYSRSGNLGLDRFHVETLDATRYRPTWGDLFAIEMRLRAKAEGIHVQDAWERYFPTINNRDAFLLKYFFLADEKGLGVFEVPPRSKAAKQYVREHGDPITRISSDRREIAFNLLLSDQRDRQSTQARREIARERAIEEEAARKRQAVKLSTLKRVFPALKLANATRYPAVTKLGTRKRLPYERFVASSDEQLASLVRPDSESEEYNASAALLERMRRLVQENDFNAAYQLAINPPAEGPGQLQAVRSLRRQRLSVYAAIIAETFGNRDQADRCLTLYTDVPVIASGTVCIKEWQIREWMMLKGKPRDFDCYTLCKNNRVAVGKDRRPVEHDTYVDTFFVADETGLFANNWTEFSHWRLSADQRSDRLQRFFFPSSVGKP